MREKDREREAHLRKEAEANFNTLLTDVIKSEIMPWKDAKKLLRKNSRWDAIADVLSRSDREKLFDTYISGLNKKTKEAFLKMLEANESVSCHSFVNLSLRFCLIYSLFLTFRLPTGCHGKT